VLKYRLFSTQRLREHGVCLRRALQGSQSPDAPAILLKFVPSSFHQHERNCNISLCAAHTNRTVIGSVVFFELLAFPIQVGLLPLYYNFKTSRYTATKAVEAAILIARKRTEKEKEKKSRIRFFFPRFKKKS